MYDKLIDKVSIMPKRGYLSVPKPFTKNMINNTLSHDTPEGIRLSLVPAGIVVRAWAFLIDLIIRHLLFGLCALCLLSFGQAGFGLLSLAYFWWCGGIL